MRPAALLLWALLLASAPLSGQEVVVGNSVHQFTFDDPSRVGLSSYSILSSTLAVVAPVRSWVAVGATARIARARLGAPGLGTVELAGPTDVDLFADFRAGPARIRGTVTLGTGVSTFSSGELVVASLASFELLPLPVRTWGTGGGYAAELALPFRVDFLDVDVRAAYAKHASSSPFEGDALEYRRGSEAYFGLGAGWSPSEASRLELRGQVVLPGKDATLGQNVFVPGDGLSVFVPGKRLEVTTLALTGLGSTLILVRAGAYWRGSGRPDDGLLPTTGDPVGLAVLSGVHTAQGRSMVRGQLETRTPLRIVPLLVSLQIRSIADPGRSWLASGGLGTEIEVFGPWPGRLLVRPSGSIRQGRIEVGPGYESAVAGWDATVTIRWEAAR